MAGRYRKRQRYYRKGRGQYKRKRNWNPGKGLQVTRQPDAFDYARTAWDGVKQIWRFVNTEVHYHDAGTTITPNNAGVLNNLASIPIGDDVDNRTGISIKPLSVNLKCQININSAATTTFVRLLVFRGKNENGTNIAITDLFASTGAQQFKVFDKRFKTKILMDKTWALGSNGRQSAFYDGLIKLNGHITYDEQDSTGATYEAGGLYFLAFSSNTTNLPTIIWQSRFKYVDN